MDAIIFATTTTVAICASLYLFALSRVDFLKRNWVKYRCNPIYMPVAGLVGQDVFTNFKPIQKHWLTGNPLVRVRIAENRESINNLVLFDTRKPNYGFFERVIILNFYSIISC